MDHASIDAVVIYVHALEGEEVGIVRLKYGQQL
jgi:hypothetical protein